MNFCTAGCGNPPVLPAPDGRSGFRRGVFVPTPERGPTAAVQPGPGCPHVPVLKGQSCQGAKSSGSAGDRGAGAAALRTCPGTDKPTALDLLVFSRLVVFSWTHSLPRIPSIFSLFPLLARGSTQAPRQPQLTPLGSVTALTFRVTGSGLMTNE